MKNEDLCELISSLSITSKFHVWVLKEIILYDFVSECKRIVVVNLVEYKNNIKF